MPIRIITGDKMKLKIKEIEDQLKNIENPNHPFLLECKKDNRKGVTDLLIKWNTRYQKQVDERKRFNKMSEYEKTLRTQGFKLLAGIDEVGRGPLAGPVVSCAVILPEDFYLPGLNDSKKISESKRELFYEVIKTEAVSIGTGIVHNKEIDEINIYEATKKAMLLAIANLQMVPDHLLIDAMELIVPMPQLSLIKGDSKSISIAAASIMAKVTRDRMMKEYAKSYPSYNFEKNMGYGTAEHLAALSKNGATPLHRNSFAPVRNVLVR
jgi:ribonuclease HII